MSKIKNIRDLLQKLENCEKAKEVIIKISNKYNYKPKIKEEYSKDKLLEELKKDNTYQTAKAVINYLSTLKDNIEEDDYSKQGVLYERLWDICIKFGLVKNIIDFDTEDNKLLHFKGNVNTGIIIKENCIELKDYFNEYLNSNIQSCNSGGYSDITFRNNNEIVISSCKYFKDDSKKDIKKYELHNLCPIINNNTEPVKIVLFINDKKVFIEKNKDANKSSQLLSKYINPYGNYENVYDLNDLEFYFAKLKNILKFYNYFKTDKNINDFKENYLKNYKKIFEPKFHQYLFIKQIEKILNNKKNKNILIGAIPRTGKTYILAGSINKYIEIFNQKEYNFLIITPAPTETIPQYTDVFNEYIDFKDLNIIAKENNKDANKHIKGGKNVFIYSKQKLDCDNKKCDNDEDKNIVKILKEHDFDIIFIDEAHYGMTTDKSKKLLDELDKQKDAFKIFITATFNKPINNFEIPENQRLFWSLDNVINLIQISNIKDEKEKHNKFKNYIEDLKSQNFFDNKFINDIIKNIYQDNFDLILNQYKNFPQPYLLTSVWKNTDEIYNEIRLANGLNKHTFSMDTIFNLNKDNKTFVNENELIELFHYYYGFPRKQYEDENGNHYNVNYDIRRTYKEYGIIPRIRNVCQNDCRTLQKPLNPFNPTTQLWFLPINDNKLENKIPVLLKLLKENFKIIYNQTLFIVSISDNRKNKNKYEDNNVEYANNKKDIKKIENENKATKKYLNIVILTGFKYNLGVSFPNVDIVVLFNNSHSADLIYQMMFRSMTDINDDNECLPNSNFCHKKKYGFIVDLNPQRTIEITNYIKSNIINHPTANINENVIRAKYMDLLNVDRDFFKYKYDIDDDIKNNEDFLNYTKAYFAKLALYFKETTDNIYNKLKNFSLNINSKYFNEIGIILKDVNFNDTNKTKKIVAKEGIDEKLKIKEQIKKEQPDKKDEDIEKEVEQKFDTNDKIKYIISQLIVILPIVSNINNIKCSLINGNNDNFEILKKELIFMLDFIKSHINLHDIFIDYVIDRCKITAFKTNDFNVYYEFYKNFIINTINSNMKSSSSSNKEDKIIKKTNKETKITKGLCQKWLENKLVNPKTGRKMNETSVMFKKLKSKCIKLLSDKIKKGGNNPEMMNYINDTMNNLTESFKINIKEPKELLEFLNDNLKPTKEKKEKNGEVFTPIDLIEEMMNKLTEANPNIWSNPNLKWLDPASGMGNFPVVVYLRLMEGLNEKMPNIEERRKHILENMLYMVEYDRTNSFMMSKIFCGDKYKLNIFTGSFIEDERYEKEGIDIFSLDETKIKKYKYKNYAEENKRFCRKVNTFGGKFDIIMGNPPFQAVDETGKRKALLNNIWSKFIVKSFNELLNNNGYLLFITPTSWMSNGFKDKNIFYKNNIIYLNINECNKWFNNVGSSFSYYIINKTNQKKNTEVICKYKNKIYNSSLFIKKDMLFLPSLLTDDSLNILDKFYNNKLDKISFNSSSEIHHWRKNHLIGLCDKSKFIYKIRHTTKNSNLCSSIKHSLSDKNKILMNLSGNLDPIFDKGTIGFTEAQLYYLLNNKDYVNILNSKLYKFIFTICKWSGFNILSMFKNIPYIEKFKDDITLYKLFKLTKDEIKLIEDIS